MLRGLVLKPLSIVVDDAVNAIDRSLEEDVITCEKKREQTRKRRASPISPSSLLGLVVLELGLEVQLLTQHALVF